MRLRRDLFVLLLVGASVLLGPPSAQGVRVTLDFESQAHTGSFVFVESHSEKGFTIMSNLVGTDLLGFFGPVDFRWPGSTALHVSRVPAIATLTNDNNETFKLVSMDISEFAPVGCPACVFGGGTLIFTGTTAGGAIVTQNIVLDMVFGLETITFSSQFEDLVSVSVSVSGTGEQFHQIDNIVLEVDAALELVGLEVTQVVQDLENSVSLVQGKTTIVRAHIQTKGADPIFPVTARLRGFRSGSELSGSPLTPTNFGGSIVAQPNALARRGISISSLNFQLPLSWTTFRTIELPTLEVQVESTGRAIDCKEAAGPTANDCKATVTFTQLPAVEVKLVAVQFTSGGSTVRPSATDLNNLEQRLLAIFPTPRVDRLTGSLDMGMGQPTLADVNARLATMRTLDDCSRGCSRRYYGALDQLATGGGLANGIPGTVSSGIIRDFTYGRNRHAHEIAHTLGRHHAVNGALVGTTVINSTTFKQGPCGSFARNSAPDFPFIETVSGFQRATLGPLTQGDNKKIFGYDTLQNRVIDPTRTFELLSYCGGSPSWRWISSFTYEGVRSVIDAIFPSTSPPVVSTKTFKVFRGFVDLATGDVEFLPFVTLESDIPPDELPSGDFTLRTLDGLGTIIDEIDFQPIEMVTDVPDSDTADTPPEVGLIIIPVEEDPSIQMKQVTVSLNGAMLGSRIASLNAPAVEVVFPNGSETLSGDTATLLWTGSDPDGDPLTYTVQFSADNGATYETLVTDHAEQNLQVSLDELPETSAGLIRVQASDGFNTADDTSDGTFTTPNSPPQVSIVTPRNNQLFVRGQSIFLDADTHDTEDGKVADANVEWTSSQDGVLGTGSRLVVDASGLSEGRHLIEVRATDSGGIPATASVEIAVTQIAPPSVELISQLIIDTLQDIVDSNPGTPLADKVEDARDKAQTASDEHNKPDDQAAVGNFEGAVGDLEAAVKDELLDTTLGIELMDQLAGVAKQLAEEAIDGAITRGGDQDKIIEAGQALAEGDAARADGLSGDLTKFKESVAKYKDTVAKAEGA